MEPGACRAVINNMLQEIGRRARLYSTPSLLWRMHNKSYQGELGSPTVNVSASTVLRDRSRDQLGAPPLPRRAAPA